MALSRPFWPVAPCKEAPCAWANFVFAGAVAKDVLPGSLVGIHGSAYTYYDGTTTRFAKAYDRATMAQWREQDVTVAPQVTRLEEMQRQFYSARQLSLTYHDVFARYEIRRAALASPSACPDYLMWALDRPLLEGMGIKGSGAVWTPRNADEARSVAIDLGMPRPQIYFGSAAGLDSACRRDETLVDKLKSWVGSLRVSTGLWTFVQPRRSYRSAARRIIMNARRHILSQP